MTHPPQRTGPAIPHPAYSHSSHPNNSPPFQHPSFAHSGASATTPHPPGYQARSSSQWANPPGHAIWPPQEDARARGYTLSLPVVRIQHRKRHKVATSCNRCRANKRKCDGGVPCASCHKKNVDCRYTDAQLSRATWGDSLFSDEKVIGVVADKPKSQLFYTGVNSHQPKDSRSLAVQSQSKQHSRMIHVTHPGPQWQTSSTASNTSEQNWMSSLQNDHQQILSHQSNLTPGSARVSTSRLPSTSSMDESQSNISPSSHSASNRVLTNHYSRIQSWTKGRPQGPSFGSHNSQSRASSVNSEPAGLEQYATKGSHVHSRQIMDEETAVKAKRVQKMAKDLIDIKRNEFTLLIPRHILHEDDELFVVKLPHANAKPLRIPPRLMTLPRDANFLVEVFFEHAYYYYPILNRAVVELCLMESHTPAAMLLLNTVFMVACKHMPRTEDTLRAIEFRERVRELRWCFEDKSQLNYMIAEMIGFMSVYGLFGIAPGQMEFCGTHRTMASKASGAIHSNPETELLENGVSRSTLPEINHQTKLWVFWSLYLRDCICKLYFGFHFGIDAKPMTAELPKIRNFVGLGGRVAPSNQHKGTSGASEATKKRRETSFGRDRQYPPDKRFLQDKERQNRGILDDRTQFRNAREYSSDSDESENDETTSSQREGSGDRDVFMPSQAERRPGASGSNFIGRTMATLSRELLESQSRGDSMPYGVSDTTENLDPQALKAHMERMEILLRSQDDPTDDGSYARVLFLEEIRLWTIGRRLSAYLSGRTATDVPVHSTSVSNSACGGSPKISSVYENGERSSRESLGMWSEQAWAQDQELQSLQADLIAWEKSIPKHLRFRSDVDHPDINHKVNGKMSVIMVAYYTITILLQSSYLPKPPEALRSKSSPKKPTSPIVNSYDNRKDTTESCRDNTPPHQWSRSRSESASAPLKETSRTSAVDDASTQAEDHTYYNTAHRICTELSNVILHHIEIMLDRYTRWCTIQAKINHALIAAQRVACLNARLDGNSSRMREEAKAGFRMGSDLYKRLAVLPAPLVIYDRPPVEDINYMNDLEKVFDQMVVSQDEERETQRLSMEQEHEHVDQDSQDPMSQKQNLGAKDGILDSYVIDPDEDGPLPTTDTIVDTSQGLQIYGGEGTEGYAFEFEETSLKGSFPLLLNPHDIHE